MSTPESAELGVALRAAGLVDLPAGTIAAVATYLEIRAGDSAAAAARRDVSPPPGAFEPLRGDPERYRSLYAAIGRRWMWFSRAGLSAAGIAALIDHPDVRALALRIDGDDAGLVELDFRIAGQCELSFLGVRPERIGTGLGHALCREALRIAFSRPIERLWLHTCTLDHPAALPFYRARGFRPYRRAVEVADDPRLTGRMPPDAAPDVPVL